MSFMVITVNNPAIYSLVSSLCFGLWPVVARYAKLSPAWLTAMVSIATLFTALSIVATREREIPLAQSLLIALVVGIMNGVGTVSYAKLIGWGSVDGTRLVCVTATVTPVVMVLASVLFFRDRLSSLNIVGVCVAVIGIFLMNLKN